MGELVRGQRLQIMLTGEEMTAVDDWRFAARMPSRASAIRELLRRGLAAEGFTVAQQGVRSKEYGVLPERASNTNTTEDSEDSRDGAQRKGST
jgi:hypothetical protein